MQKVKNLKKTKIIATLGPAISDIQTLKELIENGVDVFRVNFSHAEYKDVKEKVTIIRSLSKELNKNISILGDLQGPKLRIGKVLDEGIKLNPGDVLTFTNSNENLGEKEVYMTYKNFPNDVKEGATILIDDGKLSFKVISTNKIDKVTAQSINGGILFSKKGVNLPNTVVSLPALTVKDKEDVLYCIALGLDWIALSFVRNAKDIIELREYIAQHSKNAIPIIAKIEKPEALECIDEIIAHSNGIMVARGDLGVEIPMEEVPLVQKQLVQKAKSAAIPVIIATQMMESMIVNSVPTRAEVNDVANSIIDGADAVMLSGETSVGKNPVEVIKTIKRIIVNIEDNPTITVPSHVLELTNDDRFITDIICQNAAQLVSLTNSAAIITLSHSGYTAYQISSYRPLAHILVFTSNKLILNQLSLVWGVYAFLYEEKKSTDDTIIEVNEIAKQKGFIKANDYVINLNATPVSEEGKTNTLRVSLVY
ncbi:MAG: pyruvate kinase [Solirubrobacteraceae bacterium]